MAMAHKERTHVPAQMVIEQAKEDSLKLLSFETCNKVDPAIRFKVRELVQRAPGRWQTIRRQEKRQLICTAWLGRLQAYDTAMIQPGNGQLAP